MVKNVTLNVCDDLRFELQNKYTLVGVYHQDITIIPGPFPIRQLAFMFQIDGLMSAIPKRLTMEVVIPSLEARRDDITVPIIADSPGKTRWMLRGVIVFQDEVVQAGRIRAKIIADGVDYEVYAPQILERKQEPESTPVT